MAHDAQPVLCDPVLAGPLRFRISDGRTHAEEFTASTIEEFSINLLDALERFRAWTIDRYPIYQTRKRMDAERFFHSCRFQLHVRDTYYESAHNPLKPHWVMVVRQGLFPVVNAAAWLRDGGKTMWDGAVYTMLKIERWAIFLGYHPSGEDQLGDFLRGGGVSQ